MEKLSIIDNVGILNIEYLFNYKINKIHKSYETPRGIVWTIDDSLSFVFIQVFKNNVLYVNSLTFSDIFKKYYITYDETEIMLRLFLKKKFGWNNFTIVFITSINSVKI